MHSIEVLSTRLNPSFCPPQSGSRSLILLVVACADRLRTIPSYTTFSCMRLQQRSSECKNSTNTAALQGFMWTKQTDSFRTVVWTGDCMESIQNRRIETISVSWKCGKIVRYCISLVFGESGVAMLLRFGISPSGGPPSHEHHGAHYTRKTETGLHCSLSAARKLRTPFHYAAGTCLVTFREGLAAYDTLYPNFVHHGPR